MDQASTKKMTPGDDMHLTLLMAPHNLNLVTGQDRQHLLAFGRAAFEAGQKCQGCSVPQNGLHQIAEPSHSMSQYASKDDMLKAVMAENEQLRAQLAAARRAQGWRITEEMHVAAVKVLHRASGVDGLPQRMVDAMFAAVPQPPEAESLMSEIRTSKPEAAPVQLPDPAASAYMSEPKDDGTVCTEMMVNPGLCTTGWNMLYTEHQVRPLLAAQQFTLDELAMLTRKLVQQLRKASPGDESAEKALDYLKRKGLAGNPLRATQEQRT